MKPEPDETRNPADQQKQQRVDDECDQSKREEVYRERHNANEIANDPIHDAEDQCHQKVGQNNGERVAGREGFHGDTIDDDRREPEGDGVDKEAN